MSNTFCRRILQPVSLAGEPVEFRGSNHPPKSQPLRSHRAILQAALKARKLSHADIAKAMGWKSPATAGHKLRGRNDWSQGELERMCELAGLTVLMLAEQSDDLHLAKRPEAIEGAAILDEIPEAELAAAMALLRTYRNRKTDS